MHPLTIIITIKMRRRAKRFMRISVDTDQQIDMAMCTSGSVDAN